MCLAQGLGLNEGGNPGPQLPQEMIWGRDGDPLPLALEALGVEPICPGGLVGEGRTVNPGEVLCDE